MDELSNEILERAIGTQEKFIEIYESRFNESAGYDKLLITFLRELKEYRDTGLTPEEIMDGNLLTGWIPVEERLPEENRGVLICGKEGWQDVAWYEQGCWWTGGSFADIKKNIIAWMPLPEPYKESK